VVASGELLYDEEIGRREIESNGDADKNENRLAGGISFSVWMTIV
jgi:hypothetical protein